MMILKNQMTIDGLAFLDQTFAQDARPEFRILSSCHGDSEVMDELAKQLTALDVAEELLSSICVRGIAVDFRTQMDINNRIIASARTHLRQAGFHEGSGG